MTSQNILFALIMIFGIATYASAAYQMLRSHYTPSLFSRGVWFLLGINSFAGVALSGGTAASVILAATLFIGNFAVFIVSLKKGSHQFGLVEKISLALLVISGLTWIFLDAPLVNLAIGLVAHFIGGLPTIWRTFKEPQTEKYLHWYFFLIASLLSIVASPDKSISVILFPVYFAIFDGIMIVLANRKRLFGAK